MGYRSKVANYLLHTPFDRKAIVPQEISEKMSEKIFFEECFVHPVFENVVQYQIESINMDNFDYRMKLDELLNLHYFQKREYENFETWLENFDNIKVYTLSGHAGTGKTTYVNYLRYICTDKEWIILDVAQAIRSICWHEDEKTVIKKEEFSSPHNKVYAIILHTIKDILFTKTDEDGDLSVDIIYDNIKKLHTNFKLKYATKHPSGSGFFNRIEKCILERGEKDNKVVKIANRCKTYFEDLQKNRPTDEAIQASLDVLTILLRCLYEEEKKFIIVFDNIERFITKHEIYNQDVVDIRKNIISYCAEINERGRIHRGIFKFLMVVRNSTASMCGERLQSLDELSSRLDVSDWFDINDIITKKIEWYKKFNSENEIIKLIEQITGDFRVCADRTTTGLKLQIDPLFNGNTRLIIDFVGEIVELPSNKLILKKYQEYWNVNTDISKFSARSLIRGLLLKQLKDSDNLFKHLKTYTDNSLTSGLGIARKILTILYNHQKLNNESDIPLEKIMQELLCIQDINSIWLNENNEFNRKMIAEVLFYMNSYNRRDNDWLQFIDLQYKNSKKNIVIIDENILYDMLSSDLNNFTISIMPAGIAYLQFIVASFEFFSVRYNTEQYRPLFDTIPTIDMMETCSTIKELLCYKTILLVRNKAKECIKLMEADSSLRLFISTGKSKTHTERIIHQHTTYLDLFMQQLQETYLGNNKIKGIVQCKFQSLLEEVKCIRDSYTMN